MRRALDSVYQIISSLAHSSGRGYFDTFVSEIAAAVMADVVLISSGALNDTHLTVQAAYPSSLDPDTLTLQLTTTPDAITWQEGEAWFSDRLLQLFPEMPLARQWQAQAYVGIALKNADGETIGVCSLLYRQPQADMGRVMGLLRLLGPLAGRELALLLQRQLPQPVPDAPQVLQSMLFEAPVGIGKLDLTGRILWANPAIERMLGYSLDELLQRSISDINHPEDWQRSLECYQQIHRGECSRFTLEKRYLRKGGEILWGRVTVTLITDEQQQPDYLMVLLENIDPLKRHAEQLKLSHRVYDNLSEAILVCDADSRIISVNPAFEQITGYSGDEARGQRPSLLKSGLHDQTFYADMYHALERVGVWRGEVWNKRKNGKLYPQQLMISTLREA
ncbi:MAG: PAS domain S-box protein, partial [Aeromonas sobria]